MPSRWRRRTEAWRPPFECASFLLVLLEPDVAELGLHRRADVDLEADQALHHSSLRIVIDQHAGDVAVDDLGHHVAARDQVHLIPAVDVEDALEAVSYTHL